VYIYYKGTAYTTNTTLNLLSGSTIIGTNATALVATASGWHPFVMNGNAPEANAALSVEVDTGDPLAGTGEVVFSLKYTQTEDPAIIFTLVDDDFLTMQSWADPTVPDGWTKSGTHDATNKVTEDVTNGLKYETDGTYTDIRRTVLIVGETYNVTVNVISITAGNSFVLDVGGGSITLDTAGVLETTATASGSALLTLKRNTTATPTVIVIRSITITKSI